MFTVTSLLVVSVIVTGCSSSHLLEPRTALNYSFHRYKRQSDCKSSQFKCGSGECISNYNLCDGPKHCLDGSDETAEKCQSVNCPDQYFMCSYGACIDKEFFCDGKTDCADGSDEQCLSRTSGGSSTNCGTGKFQCANGQCISRYIVCDGREDCADGSDETSQSCKYLICPPNSFQCAYGACLDRSVRCNRQSDCADNSDEFNCTDGSVPTEHSITDCTLPSHPEHGAYTSTSCQAGDMRQACRNIPGTRVPHTWLIKYTCSQNYDLSSVTSNYYSVCENGTWQNPLNCIKLCPPLQSQSVDVKCTFGGREVTCDKPMKPGTRAIANCKLHYRESFPSVYSRLLCEDNGDWNFPLFYCTPACGVSVKLQPQILYGQPTERGDFPWMAALYYNTNNKWIQRCAGTLISPHIVLTAAHCVVLEEGNVKAKDLKVGLGKYYRSYYKPEEGSFFADIREIVYPDSYTGKESSYILDIALLDLTVSVQLTSFIMPACVDWKHNLVIAPEERGFVPGWGETENASASEEILSAQLLYINHTSCLARMEEIYKIIVTHDRFCAGTFNGSQVGEGDSGGGMTIVRNGLHYVVGVVSSKLIAETGLSLFTNIASRQHKSWLEDHRERFRTAHKNSS